MPSLFCPRGLPNLGVPNSLWHGCSSHRPYKRSRQSRSRRDKTERPQCGQATEAVPGFGAVGGRHVLTTRQPGSRSSGCPNWDHLAWHTYCQLRLPGFQHPTTEIPAPPGDHTPLRRRCIEWPVFSLREQPVSNPSMSAIRLTNR
jgi:hypothetical protein